jgi:Flp pilus assembly protein TadG
MIRRTRGGLRRDRRGATIIEFALILPVMLVLIMGLGELAYQAYIQSILSGAVQKAGRDSSLQGGALQTAAIDLAVMNVVWAAAGRATYSSVRKSYAQFGYIAPEPFTDTNHNGVRDPGECFSDINGNGSWDADPGASGQGGANDVTVYTMTIAYPRIFPTALIGWSGTATLSATTVLKNQPYATQTAGTVKTLCT